MSKKVKKHPKEIGFAEFLTKRFPDEKSAEEFFIEKRWGGTIICPYCDSDKIYKGKTRQPFKCGSCNHKFTCKTGTIMEGSHIPLRIWLLAMYIMGISRKGISSVQMSKQLGVTQKTAWYMAHRIREACDSHEKLAGTIEADETYIGGKEQNKHKDKQLNMGRGAKGKTAVAGLRSRTGKVRGKVVADTNAKTLHDFIEQNVKKKSSVITDDFASYMKLSRYGNYKHTSVNHSIGEYVAGMAHTNGIESFWALLKRGVYGTFHSISPKHLQRYVNEFAFRSSAGTQAFPFIEAICGKSEKDVLHYSKLTA